MLTEVPFCSCYTVKTTVGLLLIFLYPFLIIKVMLSFFKKKKGTTMDTSPQQPHHLNATTINILAHLYQ